MNEDDFSVAQARRSLAFLRDDFSKRLWGDEAVSDLGAWSGHFIGYSNSLQIAEGTLLRQNALRLRSELSAAREAGRDEAKNASLQSRATAAVDEFCAFLREAWYVD